MKDYMELLCNHIVLLVLCTFGVISPWLIDPEGIVHTILSVLLTIPLGLVAIGLVFLMAYVIKNRDEEVSLWY